MYNLLALATMKQPEKLESHGRHIILDYIGYVAPQKDDGKWRRAGGVVTFSFTSSWCFGGLRARSRGEGGGRGRRDSEGDGYAER